MSLPSPSTWKGSKGMLSTSREAASGEPRIGLTSRTNYDLLGMPIEETRFREHTSWYGYYDLRLGAY